MHKSDRLTGILIALQASPRTAAELAVRFEVSRRTIMRDIDALGDLGVPVIAETGRNGGYRIAEGFWLPPMHLTSDEATVLIFSLEHIGVAEQSPLGDAHRTVLEKIRAILSPAVAPDVARNLQGMSVLRHHDAPDAQVIAALRRAGAPDEWLAVTYTNASGTTERMILPLRIYTSAGRWYVDVADS
ncbi:MAG: helix-turn-helix transcriptional regulator, partial [Thermomicrobiales bacterium]